MHHRRRRYEGQWGGPPPPHHEEEGNEGDDHMSSGPWEGRGGGHYRGRGRGGHWGPPPAYGDDEGADRHGAFGRGQGRGGWHHEGRGGPWDRPPPGLDTEGAEVEGRNSTGWGRMHGGFRRGGSGHHTGHGWHGPMRRHQGWDRADGDLREHPGQGWEQRGGPQEMLPPLSQGLATPPLPREQSGVAYSSVGQASAPESSDTENVAQDEPAAATSH
jgi:hypothetical protein